MPRALIASFGFDEKYVVRAIIRHGIGAKDLLVLITGFPTEKTLSAYNYVKELAEKVGANVVLKTLDEAIYDFPRLVSNCKNILADLAGSYDEVTLLLSGGMRIIVLGLYTAAFLLASKLRRRILIEVDTEDKGIIVKIPRLTTLILSPLDLGAKKELLRVIVSRPGRTIEEYASILGKDESTIRRQVQSLAEQELVKVEGRPQRIYPTDIAQMLV